MKMEQKKPKSITDKSEEFKQISLLVERVKDKDEKAFSELYSRMYQKVYLFAFSILREEYLAEDVVQEVFIAVYKNIDSLKNNDYFTSWINKITYHNAVDYMSRIREIPMEEVRSEHEGAEDQVSDHVLKSELRHVMTRQIMRLSPEQRAVIYLRYYHDCSLKDIAEVMDCPLGTVKSRINKAKGALRRQIMTEKDLFYGFLFGMMFLSVSVKTSLKVYGMEMVNAQLCLEKIRHALSFPSLLTVSQQTGAVWGGRLAAGAMILTAGAVAVVVSRPVTIPLTEETLTVRVSRETGGYVNHNVAVSIEVEGRKSGTLKVWNEDKSLLIPAQKGDYYEVMIEKNGNYQAVWEEEDGRNAEAAFHIEEIDKKAPQISRYENDALGEKVCITLEPEESGLDLDQSYGRDSKGNRLKLETSQEELLAFDRTNLPVELYLYDQAGNYTHYYIEEK